MLYHVFMDDSLFVLTQKELMQWIFDEKLKPSAYIQRGHKDNWKKISDTNEWSFFYNSENSKWIVLKKQSEKNSFRQKGPYSTEQVCFFLRIGCCSAQDFIWREGFKKWNKISLVSEFCTHPADTIRDILIQQIRKYKTGRARIVRYSPSGENQHYPEF